MRALLIFNKNRINDFRVVVALKDKSLKEKVHLLLAEEKMAEAFSFIMAHAQVEAYIPPGEKLRQPPDFTFIEDML